MGMELSSRFIRNGAPQFQGEKEKSAMSVEERIDT